MRFSERRGIKPIKNVILTGGMDDDLRNGLWNALDLFCWEEVIARYGYNYHECDEIISRLCRSIWLIIPSDIAFSRIRGSSGRALVSAVNQLKYS